MFQDIEKGMTLLIFKNPSSHKKYSRDMYYTNFIIGKVIDIKFDCNKYNDETYKIYTVLGSDGKEYKGEYGDYSDFPDKYFFLTLDDYKESLKNIMQSKIDEARKIMSELNKFADVYEKLSEISNEKSNEKSNRKK